MSDIIALSLALSDYVNVPAGSSANELVSIARVVHDDMMSASHHAGKLGFFQGAADLAREAARLAGLVVAVISGQQRAVDAQLDDLLGRVAGCASEVKN